MYRDLEVNGRADGNGGLSPRTIRYTHTIIQKAFDDAMKANRLVRNPARAAEPPTAKAAKAPTMKTWDGPTVDRFLKLSAGEDDRYYAAWFTLATTGARRGEVLGVRWSDLDLDEGTMWIRQTVGVVGHQATFRSTTKTSEHRQIALDASTIATLRAHRKQQAEERLALGPGYASYDLVFCLPDGNPYNPDRFSREFKRRIKRWNLPEVRVHDLRHTWATLALEAGVQIVVVSRQLGHATTAVTADTYSHVSTELATSAAEKVASSIFGG